LASGPVADTFVTKNYCPVVQAEKVKQVGFLRVADSHKVIITKGALSESFTHDDRHGLSQSVIEYAKL
jgi:hypothetical protein